MKLRNIIALYIFTGLAYSSIINVPADQLTIQAAIDTSGIGDTVLVQPGTYYENIDFLGKNIVVASLYLTAGDSSAINQTIIDGHSVDRVVTFTNGEDSTAVLSGFTIENGQSDNFGGGIYCGYSSSPTLKNLVITGNTANQGGGIFCSVSSPIIEDVNIFGNYSYGHGGGIYFYVNSAARISRLSIYDNTAFSNGGGIYCYYSDPVIENVTISRNLAESGSGFYCSNSEPQITNSILWYNLPQEIFELSGNVHLTYSNIHGSWPGEGNISDNPLFCDPANNVFTLAENSPCLGSGSNGSDMGVLGQGCDSLAAYSSSTWYVSSTGVDSSGHGGPDNPLRTIMNAVYFASEGDTVLVLPGTYDENINYFGKNINIGSQFLTTGDTTYIYQTILTNSSSTSIVSFEHGEDSTASLTGFTISNSISIGNGGGISLANFSSPHLKHLIIKQNSSFFNGGAIYCENSSPLIEHVIINENTATFNGGGLYCFNSNPRLVNTTIVGNLSLEGGGIYLISSEVAVVNSILWNNVPREIDVLSGSTDVSYSDILGGWEGEGNINIYPYFCDFYNGDLTVAENSPCIGSGISGSNMGALDIGCGPLPSYAGPKWFVSNYGSNSIGDGSQTNPFSSIQWAIVRSADYDTIFVEPGTYYENIKYYGKDIVITSTFESTGDTSEILGTVINGSHLGPVVSFEYNESADAELTGFTITNGASDHGGGIRCIEASPRLSNLVITGISTGGAVYCEGSSPVISNLTIGGNLSSGSPSIYCLESDPTIINTILWDNDGPAEIYFAPNAGPSSATISYSNIQGGEAAVELSDNGVINWLEGNIQRDPLFCDLDSADFTLAVNSPCLSNGENQANIGALNGGCDSIFIDRSIWYVSTGGDDVPNNGLPAHPMASVQYAINFASASDTIIILPGHYRGGIDYLGKNLTIASQFLTTGDTAYIEQTIIDADSSGSAVIFGNGETANASLCGVTVTNGYASEGGGIYCGGSSPDLHNLVIVNNSAVLGGGIYCGAGSSPTLFNITLSGNTADFGGGIYGLQTSLIIANAIIWNNFPQEIYISSEGNSSLLSLINTNITGGAGSIETNDNGTVLLMGGNINEDPLFCNPENGDFSLASNSPCAGTGGPNNIIGALPVGCEELGVIEPLQTAPTEFSLFQNYPNPFNPLTVIEYSLPSESLVQMTVYNLAGHTVAELINQVQPAGVHQVVFRASNLPAGLYFYRISASGYDQARKMIVLK